MYDVQCQACSPGLDGKISLEYFVELLANSCLGRNNLINLGNDGAKQRGSTQEQEDTVHLHSPCQWRDAAESSQATEAGPARHQWWQKYRLPCNTPRDQRSVGYMVRMYGNVIKFLP